MKLFEPIVLRGIDIPNRIVMPSMTTRLATPEGVVTPELIRYYVARAEGGAGLITVEMCSPEPAGRHRAGELGILHDRFLPGLRELTSRLGAAGARSAAGDPPEKARGQAALLFRAPQAERWTGGAPPRPRARGVPYRRLPPAGPDVGGDAGGGPARVSPVSRHRPGASVTPLPRPRPRSRSPGGTGS